MNGTDDTQPAYDIYVEEDRVTFVRRPEQVIDSTPAQEPFRWVPAVLLGAHGLIALLSLALAAYLTLIPATAMVYALADRIPSVASVHSLPAVSMSLSQSVPTTGHVHMPATQARGLVVFYNSLTQSQVIDSGTLLIGSDGEQIVTDQAAYVPGSSLPVMGHVSVWAHALNPGTEGNIRAGDISGPCCRAFIQAVNTAFTGGHDARDIQTVTKADIDTATAGPGAALDAGAHGFVASPRRGHADPCCLQHTCNEQSRCRSRSTAHHGDSQADVLSVSLQHQRIAACPGVSDCWQNPRTGAGDLAAARHTGSWHQARMVA